jgi:raffinose/stachyose/melibiose transport system substrate-binding protein
MKKILVCILLAICTAGVFAGGGKESGGGTVTLNLWHIWASDTESSKAPFEKVLRDFQAAYPNIKLVVDATENEAYKTKIRAAVAAKEAPDVFFYWAGGTMKGFVDAGALLPLDPYLDAATQSRLLSGTLGNMTFNNQVYGLPHSQAAGTFFVNQELFDQNGLKVPTNWDELISVCQAFLAKGITPFTIGAKENWCIAMYFDLMYLHQAGFQATNAALFKTGPFNTPDTVEAARKLQQLIDMGAFGQGAMGISRDESEVPFYEGKVPMYVNGSWTIGNLNRPDCAVRDKVKIYPFPALSARGTVRDFTGGVSEIFVVNADTKYKAEATTLLKYIAEHFSAELYLAGAGLPTWNVQVDETKIDPLTRNLVDLFKTAETYTLWWDTNLEGADAQLYLNTLSSLFAKQITPQQFAETMQTINN